MSEPSICVGCRHARWDRDKLGRLHRDGSGMCGALDGGFRLPAAFWLSADPFIAGGLISRRKQGTFRYFKCDFKEEIAP